MEKDELYARQAVCPASDVGCNILIDTFDTTLSRNMIISQVRVRGEVKIVRITGQTRTKTERETRLKISDLGECEQAQG